MGMRGYSLSLLALLVSGLSACVEVPDAGRATFENNCVACHGPLGRGDGAIAPDLPVPPADLAVLAAANGGAFPAGAVMAKIYGYPGVTGHTTMPEFGPLLEGPQVIWVNPEGAKIPTPKALVELSDYLESLQIN